MRRHEQWIVTCAVLWLSACSTLPRPVGPDNNQARREASVRTRWVGVTRLWTGSCPVPRTAGWTVRPLFPLNGLERGLGRSARKAKLNRFCVYEYKGSAPASGQLALPPEISARLRSFEPDRVGVSGMGSLEATTSAPFYQRFFEQVQIPADLPVENTSHVRLAFLDTQPTGEGIPHPAPPEAPQRSLHGYTLTHIAGHLAGPLACRSPESLCAVEVASRLALPLVSFNPVAGQEQRDETFGGFRGTFADLSQALWAEITHWNEMPPGLRPPHLVLNLSAGWDGEKLGGWEEDEADMTPDVQGVYRALKAAADQNILVIAAAGNERGGPNPTGQPLLPGGWEKPLRLSKLQEWGWKSLDKPLVYAASGIDGWGRPLVNTRKNGEAPRVAYADHVVVPDFYEPERYTATLTGTSVAATVVSTIAAVVWSYRPELTPTQVMETLSLSGEALSTRKNDFSVPSVSPLPNVQRITLCRALSQAWSTSETQRPSLDCAAEAPEVDLESFTATQVGSIEISFPFPATGHPDLRDGPWIGPQPAMDPCPSCAVDPDGRFAFLAPPPSEIAVVANASLRSYENTMLPDPYYRLLIEISDDWPAGVLREATLELFGFDPTTGRKKLLSGWSIVTSPLESGSTLEVTFDDPGEPFQAALSFVLDPPEGAPEGTPSLSVVSPLFVD
jgi:Subtilase family